MDVSEVKIINKGDSLPNQDNVYRHTVSDWKEKLDKFIPLVRCFSLSEADKIGGYGLSVDWDKIATPDDTISRIGCSYKPNSTNFKDYTNREIYSLSVSFLKSLNGIENVIYDPIEFNPIKKGSPNNLSHSQIIFSEEVYKKNEPFILLQIRNHAKNRKIDFDMESVRKMVEEYRIK